MNKKHLLLIGLGAAGVAFVLANAPSGTGIYATPVGASLASVYTYGRSLAGPAAVTSTAAVSTTTATSTASTGTTTTGST
jgi:hypothetical protein